MPGGPASRRVTPCMWRQQAAAMMLALLLCSLKGADQKSAMVAHQNT